MRLRITPTLLLAVLLLTTSTAAAETLIDCYDGSLGADNYDRGFYVPDYPGATIDGLDMVFYTYTAEPKTIELTVRLNTYDGPVIVSAQQTFVLGTDEAAAVVSSFVFPPADIPTGSTVTFAFEILSGEPDVLYECQCYDSSCPIMQTNYTNPPLDTVRRQGIRAVIYGDAAVPADAPTWGFLKRSYR